MENTVLYRKHRPQTFEDIVGQEPIVTTLKNALKLNRVAHAYLFAGPRGTGKTSTARIMAKALNCQKISANKTSKEVNPCNECMPCKEITNGSFLDLIEIDAASNRGIDEIRNLKQGIQSAPAHGGKKIYIIDEVHMMTKEAFNALLKTLEEPPDHAVFFLATTEPHQIPQTIISRTQRFDFKQPDIATLTKHLEKLAKAEKTEIETEALYTIAQMSEGSFRDAISLLDQVSSNLSNTQITQKSVLNILGLSDQETIWTFINAILQTDTKKAIELIQSVITSGKRIEPFAQAVVNNLRELLFFAHQAINPSTLSKSQKDQLEQATQTVSKEQLELLLQKGSEALLAMKSTPITQLPLELFVFEAIESLKPDLSMSQSQDTNKSQPQALKSIDLPIKNNTNKQVHNSVSRQSPEPQPKEMQGHQNSSKIKITLEEIKKRWSEVLTAVKPLNHSVEALLKGGRPEQLQQDQLTIGFYYPFHKERIQDQKNRAIVESGLQEVFQIPFTVNCILIEQTTVESNQSAYQDDQKQEDIVKNALQVFGGKLEDK